MDIDRITQVLREVARTEVMPAFRNLAPGDVERKSDDADDVVSRVDRAVEARLTQILPGLLPGSTVVGEEAVHAQPELLKRLEADAPVWLIDPVDGTRAFVAGEVGFGVMLALIVKNETVASWILLPFSDECFVTERGGGAFLNGTRIRVQRSAKEVPHGTLYRRYMAEDAAQRLSERAGEQFVPAKPSGSAAAEYTGVVKGDKDFVVYHRLFPWDHAPGVLLVNEAGGYTRLLDGRSYAASTRFGPLIVAADSSIGEKVQTWW